MYLNLTDLIQKELESNGIDDSIEKEEEESVLGKRDQISSDSEEDDEDDEPPKKVMKVEEEVEIIVDNPDIIREFEEMLGEHKVNQFSFWDMMLPKLQDDPRFKAITSKKQQKQLFESYANDSAKRKQQELSKARTLFQEHLDEARKKNITSFNSFTKTFNNSSALKILSKEEQRKLFDKEIGKIQKQKELDAKENKKQFIQMLRECKSIHSDSRWSRVKERLRDDYRYNLLSSIEREDAFYDYRDQLRKEEDYLRHNRKIQEKNRNHREHLATRRDFEENEAELQLICLFSEYIKRPCSWESAKDRLYDKSRFRTRYLSSRRKEELFNQHLKSLEKEKYGDFYQLLKDFVPPIPLGAIYETCQFKLQKDSRYNSLKTDEERKEVFIKYQNNLLEEAEKGFKDLLRNMKKEITLSKSGPQFESALKLIQRDPRWHALDLRSDRRDELLEEYKSAP